MITKSLTGEVPVQHLARPSIQEGLHMLDLTTRHAREVRALREELPDQAVGILVGPPLPRTVGIPVTQYYFTAKGRPLGRPHRKRRLLACSSRSKNVTSPSGRPTLPYLLSVWPNWSSVASSGREYLERPDEPWQHSMPSEPVSIRKLYRVTGIQPNS